MQHIFLKILEKELFTISPNRCSKKAHKNPILYPINHNMLWDSSKTNTIYSRHKIIFLWHSFYLALTYM